MYGDRPTIHPTKRDRLDSLDVNELELKIYRI